MTENVSSLKFYKLRERSREGHSRDIKSHKINTSTQIYLGLICVGDADRANAPVKCLTIISVKRL